MGSNPIIRSNNMKISRFSSAAERLLYAEDVGSSNLSSVTMTKDEHYFSLLDKITYSYNGVNQNGFVTNVSVSGQKVTVFLENKRKPFNKMIFTRRCEGDNEHWYFIWRPVGKKYGTLYKVEND